MSNIICLIITLLKLIDLSSSLSLIETARAIADNSFFFRKVTVVSWNINERDSVTDFLKSYEGCVLPAEIDKMNFKITSEQYVFFAENPEEYNLFLSVLNRKQIKPIKIILVIDTTDDQKIDFENIFSISLKNDIVDILVVDDINNTGNASVTTYFPYSDNSCDNINAVSLEPDQLNFPNKFQNFKGCPVKVSMINHKPFTYLVEENGKQRIGGIDGRLLHLIANKLNFSIVPHFPYQGSYGYVCEGQWTGAVGDLVYERADLSMTSAILNFDRYSELLTSSSYKTVEIVWIAPNRRRVLPWTSIHGPLTKNLGLPLFVTFVIYVLITNLTSRMRQTGRRNSNNHFILYTWATFLNQNVIYKETDTLMRYIFAIWLLYSIILRIIFEGDMVSVLQNIYYEPPLKSFEEAVPSMDGYSGLDSVLPYYENTSVPDNYNIIYLNQVEPLIHRIANGERHLLVIDTWSIIQYGIKVQTIEEPVVRAPVCIYFRRRWSPSVNIDLVLRQMIETGLYQHIVDQYFHIFSTKLSSDNNDDLTYNPITMADMSPCFIGLIVELIFCTLVLIGEIIYHRIKTRSTVSSQTSL